MKKTLVAIAAIALAATSYGQGTLTVVNNVSGSFRAPIYGPQAGDATQSLTGQSALGVPGGGTVYTGALLQGTGYRFAVYAGASSITDPSQLTLLVSTTFRTSAGTGLPAGLIADINDVPIPGVTAGNQAALEVRVWDLSSGATFDEAFTRGRSGLFLSGPLGGVGTGGPVLTPTMTGWTSFNIYTVPEPSTFVLAGLGAASLLIFRRRK